MGAGLQDFDIWNMALGHLGISARVAALTDTSVQGLEGAFWYPKCRDILTQNAPWDFSYTQAPLVQETVPAQGAPQYGLAAPGWQYSYVFPSSAMQVVALATLSGVRFGPQFWLGYWWPSVGMNLSLPKIPFRVEESLANPGALCILCDILSTSSSPLFAFYIAQTVSTINFSPMFCEALSYLCAWKAGNSLRASQDKIDAAQHNYDLKRAEALAQVLNQAQQDVERDSPSVVARW